MEERRDRSRGLNTGIGVGGSSVLAVFVVLCLTTFGVLSLVSARADLRLSQRSAEQVTRYYEADARGQFLLSRLGELTGGADQLPHQARDLKYVTASYASPQGEILVEFTIPMGEDQTLAGRADIAPLLTGGRVRLLRYQVEAADHWAGDGTLDLWEGSFPISLVSEPGQKSSNPLR